ncbi:MAG: hypothetical protein H7338_22135 [Candidatus Sericytochromatia bacterium]|nr:hypothetical protein [Candidatus Sericytochromatia bacterium]
MAPLLPPRKPHPLRCHNPRVPDRNAMNTVLLVLRTGYQWHSPARWEPRADTYLAMRHLTLGLICWRMARSLKRPKRPSLFIDRYIRPVNVCRRARPDGPIAGTGWSCYRLSCLVLDCAWLLGRPEDRDAAWLMTRRPDDGDPNGPQIHRLRLI